MLVAISIGKEVENGWTPTLCLFRKRLPTEAEKKKKGENNADLK